MKKFIFAAVMIIIFAIVVSKADGHPINGVYQGTTYGPPWDSIEGGGWTKTGIKLGEGKPRDPYRHRHLIAVDPRVIPMHTRVKVWPNPLNWRGSFTAEDIGGAIIGRHIDIYDWKADGVKDVWNRPVRVRVVKRVRVQKALEIPRRSQEKSYGAYKPG